MEQDLINVGDLLSLEDHKEKVSCEPFIHSSLPFTGLFIFFWSVTAGSQKMWKGEDWHLNPLTCFPEKKICIQICIFILTPLGAVSLKGNS